jgi:glutathione peroxidase
MSIYDFKVTARDGSQVDLGDYRGQVLVIVNTASKCGFTPQFAGLEELYQEYKDRGLTVIGFPCNQFGNQDPGSNEEIAEFCQVNYGVTFPMMAKVDVKGDDADPLFVWLTSEAPGFLGMKTIKWNFSKFLIGRDGDVVARFSSKDEPAKMREAIEEALAVAPA